MKCCHGNHYVNSLTIFCFFFFEHIFVQFQFESVQFLYRKLLQLPLLFCQHQTEMRTVSAPELEIATSSFGGNAQQQVINCTAIAKVYSASPEDHSWKPLCLGVLAIVQNAQHQHQLKIVDFHQRKLICNQVTFCTLLFIF